MRPGDELVGEARVVHAGRTAAYVETSLTRAQDGGLVARASATNVVLEDVPVPTGDLPGTLKAG